VELVSFCPLSLGAVSWSAPEPMLTVLVAATYSLAKDGEAALADAQEPLRADDFVPRKARADVILVGHARAAEPASSIRARISVGPLDKRFVARAPSPAPAIRLTAPFLYDGEDAAARPVVVGPVTPPGGDPNLAPPDQQIEGLRANAPIALEGLLPGAPRRRAWLPGDRPRVFHVGASGPGDRAPEIALAPDTLWIDADRAICTLTWRGAIALARCEVPPVLLVLALERRGAAQRWAKLREGIATARRLPVPEAGEARADAASPAPIAAPPAFEPLVKTKSVGLFQEPPPVPNHDLRAHRDKRAAPTQPPPPMPAAVKTVTLPAEVRAWLRDPPPIAAAAPEVTRTLDPSGSLRASLELPFAAPAPASPAPDVTRPIDLPDAVRASLDVPFASPGARAEEPPSAGAETTRVISRFEAVRASLDVPFARPAPEPAVAPPRARPAVTPEMTRILPVPEALRAPAAVPFAATDRPAPAAPPAEAIAPPIVEAAPLPVERYAAIKAALWDDGAARAEVLARHGLDEASFRAEERRQAEAIEADQREGRADRALALAAALDAIDRAAAPPEMAIGSYAALRIAIEEAADRAPILAAASIGPSAWRRIHRAFSRRALADAAFAAELRAALAEARRAPRSKEPVPPPARRRSRRDRRGAEGPGRRTA
jgi:Uncharacterized protein conserved in bacteria (DUF2169)